MQETGFAESAARAIAAAVVVPVIRTETAAEALEVAEWAIEQGLPALELTATTPGWVDALRHLRERSPDTFIGVGTLRTADDARLACAEGAGFLVSPVPAPAVATIGAGRGVLTIGGGFTPAEVLAAADGGIAKLFPAHAVGPRYLRSVLAVAPPGTRVVPTGGIALDDVQGWLDAGAYAVGIGSELRPTRRARRAPAGAARGGEGMTRVAVMGECMIELSHLDDRTLALGYAGDVYNVAVSLARWGTEVAFVSRLGDDHHSAAMLEAWREEGLDTSLTDQLPGYAPGLYMIRTDGDGERSFTYWRSASPARELLADDAHAEHVRTGLAGTDWLLLSGISLSLLSDAAHARLLALLDALTAAGTRVAFDSNYRPAGWPDAATAAARMDEVLARTALALPTLDDEQALHGDRDAEATLRRIAALGVEEVVVKLGADGALVQGELVPAEPGVDVVDTTGAGDAFDAGYLHARLAGLPPVAAAAEGARLAATVLRHRGAIVPAEAMPAPPALA